MKTHQFIVPLLVAISTWGASAFAQDSDKPASQLECFNSEAIDWYVPGSFDEAHAKAKEQNRMLLMRALGFGLDELGASCATKGCW